MKDECEEIENVDAGWVFSYEETEYHGDNFPLKLILISG